MRCGVLRRGVQPHDMERDACATVGQRHVPEPIEVARAVVEVADEDDRGLVEPPVADLVERTLEARGDPRPRAERVPPRASRRIGQPSPGPGRDAEEAHERPQLGRVGAGRKCHVGGVREEDEPVPAVRVGEPVERREDPVVGLRRDARRDVEHDDRGRRLRGERRRRPVDPERGHEEPSGRAEHGRQRDQLDDPRPARRLSGGAPRPRAGWRSTCSRPLALRAVGEARPRPPRQAVDATRRRGRRSWRALPPRASSPPARGAQPPAAGPGSAGPATPAGAERRARTRPPRWRRHARRHGAPSRRGRRRRGRGAPQHLRRAPRGRSATARSRQRGISVCRRYAGSRAATTAAGTRGTTAIDTARRGGRASAGDDVRGGERHDAVLAPGHAPGTEAGEPLGETHLAAVTLDRGRARPAGTRRSGRRMRASRASSSESSVARTT